MTLYNALAGRFGTNMGELPPTPDAELYDKRLAQFAAEHAKGQPKPQASRFFGSYPQKEDNPQRNEPYKLTKQGTAIIPIIGELVNRGEWVGAESGLVSYEGLKHQLSRARNDNRVRNVILDMDSPGGEAVGFETAARAVMATNAVKPVYAVVNGMAASGGYALAAGAKRIITTETGISGSIGVIMLHLDQSRAVDMAGVTPTFITAGAHKADGNALEPLSDDVRGALQAEVDTLYVLFTALVGEGRKGRMSARAARETEARTFIGREAVDAKLADDTGTFEEVLAELSRGARKSPSQGSTKMSKLTLEPEADESAPQIDVAALAAQAAASATEAATKAQTERLAAIMADERSKGRERVCVKIACKAPLMSAEDVLDLAAETPAAEAIRPIAERTEATGANRVSSLPTEPAPKNETGWDKVVSKKNERTQREASSGNRRTALRN